MKQRVLVYLLQPHRVPFHNKIAVVRLICKSYADYLAIFHVKPRATTEQDKF
jgi:hypothetical protein